MKKSTFTGFLAFLGLFSLYFVLMFIFTRSILATMSQFQSLWFWILSISIGFGVQTFLYVEYRRLSNLNYSNRITVVSGTASTISMVACCTHHLVDFMPFVWISVGSAAFTSWQKPLLFISLIVNLFGIVLMLRNLRKLKITTN